MIANLILLGTLLAVAAGVGFLILHLRRFRAEERAQFEKALSEELKRNPAGIQFDSLVEQCGVSREVAEQVASDIYARLCSRCLQNGHISPAERSEMDSLSHALAIPPARAKEIEEQAMDTDWHSTKATRRSQFEHALWHELQKGLSRFKYDSFIRQWSVPAEVARQVAEEFHQRLCGECLKNGKITDFERQQMDGLASALALTPDTAGRIERQAKEDYYRAKVNAALEKSLVGAVEAAELGQLRSRLGISTAQAFQVVREPVTEHYLALFRGIVAGGRISSVEAERLRDFRTAFALSDEAAAQIIHKEALQLYRGYFYGILQKENIEPEDEKKLTWLASQLGLSSADVRSYEAELREAKRLAAYRQGKLPSRSTTKLLEGGEICHWEGRCTFEWRTPTQTKEATGELIVTSQQVIFTSATKRFTHSPSKIVDIRAGGDGLYIQTTGSQGTGFYFVKNAQELEAILIGVVRTHKYLQTESFSSSQSRHIPDDVKRQVWARDGGRCVKCRAVDYLEFDHIIPHAKGGANTVNNVQVLCRRCNQLKRDRI